MGTNALPPTCKPPTTCPWGAEMARGDAELRQLIDLAYVLGAGLLALTRQAGLTAPWLRDWQLFGVLVARLDEMTRNRTEAD